MMEDIVSLRKCNAMRKLCPNYDREDGLETVLEVPMPEEVFCLSNMRKSMRKVDSRRDKRWKESEAALFGGHKAVIRLLLGVLGAPLMPCPLQLEGDSNYGNPLRKSIDNQTIEASMAKYIVRQFMAAVGGETAVDSILSMCANGEVRMNITEYSSLEKAIGKKSGLKRMKKANFDDAVGGFVLWQKKPDLWCLEMVASGYKIAAGGDGSVTWRQTPWQHSHPSRGPARPLRSFLLGIDPSSTATLFANSIWVGEETINDEECFILKREADPTTLRARSTENVAMIRHKIQGFFSQRTGLLVQLEDSHLLRINPKRTTEQGIYWETTMETQIQDYRAIEGVQIAHLAKTNVTLLRYGEGFTEHSRTRMEETWRIAEIDFNVRGLSDDCFLVPQDLIDYEEDRVKPMAKHLHSVLVSARPVIL